MPAIAKPRRPDFTGAFLKLQRAKAHVEEFKTAADAFFNDKVYSAWPQIDPVSQCRGYVIGWKGLPPGLALMVGDAIHNLRTSLDHLIAACAIANRGDEENTHFPIRKTKADFERGLERDVIKFGAGARAAELVRQVRPYRRGNRPLFAMHRLDLADKHRLLIAVKHTVDVTVTLEGEGRPSFRDRFSSAGRKPNFIPIAAGLEDRLLPAEIDYTGDVVFGARQPRSGKPCIEELAKFVVATEHVVRLFRSGF